MVGCQSTSESTQLLPTYRYVTKDIETSVWFSTHSTGLQTRMTTPLSLWIPGAFGTGPIQMWKLPDKGWLEIAWSWLRAAVFAMPIFSFFCMLSLMEELAVDRVCTDWCLPSWFSRTVELEMSAQKSSSGDYCSSRVQPDLGLCGDSNGKGRLQGRKERWQGGTEYPWPYWFLVSLLSGQFKFKGTSIIPARSTHLHCSLCPNELALVDDILVLHCACHK